MQLPFVDLLASDTFLSQALLSILKAPAPLMSTQEKGGHCVTSMYLLRTLFDSPLSAMVRGLRESKMSFSQVDGSLVQGLVDSNSSSTAQYFVQSLLRFGSSCEKALRNEYEGPVDKVVFLSRFQDSLRPGELIFVLVYEPISSQLWTYNKEAEQLDLIGHFSDFNSIEQQTQGSGLESICFDVQSEFKQFGSNKTKASWDRLLDFAHEVEIDEECPSAQMLESRSLFEGVFSSLAQRCESDSLKEIANLTLSEVDFELDVIAWFDSILKTDLTRKLRPDSAAKLQAYLAEHLTD